MPWMKVRDLGAEQKGSNKKRETEKREAMLLTVMMTMMRYLSLDTLRHVRNPWGASMHQVVHRASLSLTLGPLFSSLAQVGGHQGRPGG